ASSSANSCHLRSSPLCRTAQQYQREEHFLILRRMRTILDRLRWLLNVMSTEELSFPENVLQLRSELADHYRDDRFQHAQTMGAILRCSLEHLSERHDPTAALGLGVPLSDFVENLFD
ncbi:MAG: hypothetical protein SNJ52_00615, partial [Verrucomicrobiia bacterium]